MRILRNEYSLFSKHNMFSLDDKSSIMRYSIIHSYLNVMYVRSKHILTWDIGNYKN